VKAAGRAREAVDELDTPLRWAARAADLPTRH
jgi:hypothetical protein